MPKLGKKDFKYEQSDTVKDRKKMQMINELTKSKLESKLSGKRVGKAPTKHADEFAHLKLG